MSKSGPTTNNLDRPGAPFWQRYLVAIAVASIALSGYLGVGRLTESLVPIDLSTSWDRAIPFMPWTMWLYLPAYAAFFHLGVYQIKQWDTFLRAAVALFICDAVAFISFALIHSPYPRPAVYPSEGLTGEMFRFLYSFDPPHNTFPSLHVAMLLTVALACYHENRLWGRRLLVLVWGPALSILSTKQHYLADLAGGTLLAFVAHVTVFSRKQE